LKGYLLVIAHFVSFSISDGLYFDKRTVAEPDYEKPSEGLRKQFTGRCLVVDEFEEMQQEQKKSKESKSGKRSIRHFKSW